MTKRSALFSPEVRERAVRMVFDHQGEHGSQYGTIQSIALKHVKQQMYGRAKLNLLEARLTRVG